MMPHACNAIVGIAAQCSGEISHIWGKGEQPADGRPFAFGHGCGGRGCGSTAVGRPAVEKCSRPLLCTEVSREKSFLQKYVLTFLDLQSLIY